MHQTPKCQFLLDWVKSWLPAGVFVIVNQHLHVQSPTLKPCCFPGVYSVYQQNFFKLLAKKHIGAPLIILFLVNSKKNTVHVVFTSCGIKLWLEWVCCFPLRINPFNTFTEIYCKSEIFSAVITAIYACCGLICLAQCHMPSEKAFVRRKNQLCVISAFKPISHNHHGDILNAIKHTGVLPCTNVPSSSQN